MCRFGVVERPISLQMGEGGNVLPGSNANPGQQVRIRERDWMVIDLETAALADQVLPPEYRLVGWSEHTLDAQSRYVAASDMRQIGVALRSCGVVSLSTDATDFITKLEAKHLDAPLALQHQWLQQRRR